MKPRAPGSPPTVPAAAALADSQAWATLAQRLQRSQAAFELIGPLLPAGLRAQVRPGPIDDEGWTLLAPNAAASAKLRQCLPALAARLAEAWGGSAPPIRVRILTNP